MTHPVTVQRDGSCAHIMMDDGKANALSTSMLLALNAALKDAAQADAVLLTGRAKVFCGGLDLAEVVPKTEAELGEFLVLFHRVFRSLLALERPLVVAVAGSAVAGGAILMCAGDVRLGAQDSGKIGVNEARLGIPFPSTALEIIRLALPPAEATRALVLGEVVSKEDAQKRGFFHELTAPDALMDRARQQWKDAALAGPEAVAIIKRTLRADVLRRVDDSAADLDRKFIRAWRSPQAQERLTQVLASLTRR